MLDHAYTRTDENGNELYSFDFPNLEGFGEEPKEEPDRLAQLAIFQALYKVVASAVSTKDPDNLRGQVDDDLMDMYAKTGAKSFDIRVNGEKVGTASVKTTKGKTETKLFIDDFDAYMDWLDTDGSEYRDIIVQQFSERILDLILSDGVIPNGCSVHEVKTAERAVGTSIRVDPMKVYEAAGPMLGSVVRGALTGGTE